MGVLTNIFYLISTALLIPVMLALLWFLARTLLSMGQVLHEHLARAEVREELAAYGQALEKGDARSIELPRDGLVAQTLGRLQQVARNDVLAGKVLHDAELAWQAELGRLRDVARFGPSLGLMGTLIPLGPALVGLAAGDLQTMSGNLVIAFATTVVGLLIGTLAVALLGIKKRWYQADALLVQFAADRLPQLEWTREEVPDSPGVTEMPVSQRPVAVSVGPNRHMEDEE